MAKDPAALLARIADTECQLPVAELHALSDLEPHALTAFQEMWSTVAIHRRRELMRHLADICQHNFEVDFGPIAQLGMQDEDSLVRLAAIDIFWDLEDLELIQPLLDLGENDPEPAVQARAVNALGQFVMLGELEQIPQHRFEQLAAKLLAMIHSPETSMLVCAQALESVAAASLTQVPDLIEHAYHSDEKVLKISAVSAMGRTADTVWEPAILAELESVNPNMRYHAAQSAGQLELQSALPQLIALLDDPIPEVLTASIKSLGTIGGKRAREALETVKDDDEIGYLAEQALELVDFSNSMPSAIDFSDSMPATSNFDQ